MSDPNRLEAHVRTEFGKGAARRTRRDGQVPAVLYGHGTDPRHLASFPPGTTTVPHGSADAVGALESADLVVAHAISGTASTTADSSARTARPLFMQMPLFADPVDARPWTRASAMVKRPPTGCHATSAGISRSIAGIAARQ